MKVTTEELLALQDDPLFDPERKRELESDPKVAVQLRLLRGQRLALREMPDLQMPAESWSRIVAAVREKRPRFSRRMAMGLATAACAALVAVVAINVGFSPDVQRQSAAGAVPGGDPGAAMSVQTDVGRLREKSRQLEQALRQMPRSPAVRRMDTAAPIVELQDRIALVDYKLNQAGSAGLAERDAAELWQQRVELMNRLLRARYVESRYYAF